MDPDSQLNVTPTLSIPRNEIQYRASRSGGAGGQHVNTSSTRIELLWDLEKSLAVTDEERQRLRTKLSARLDAEGNVRIVASDRRSQQQNKLSAEARLVALVKQALHVAKKRRATKPTKAAKERRLVEKKKRSTIKKNRRVEIE